MLDPRDRTTLLIEGDHPALRAARTQDRVPSDQIDVGRLAPMLALAAWAFLSTVIAGLALVLLILVVVLAL